MVQEKRGNSVFVSVIKYILLSENISVDGKHFNKQGFHISPH